MKSDGIPNTTLQDRVRFLHVFDGIKHDLCGNQTPEEYADGHINRMTNAEFLEAISNAFEHMKDDEL